MKGGSCFIPCPEKIKKKESYDVTLSEIGLVEGKLRLCLSAVGGYGLGDKRFLDMLHKSTLSRQEGDLPVEEVSDFSVKDEAALSELKQTGSEGGTRILVFLNPEDFNIPGDYIFEYGGRQNAISVFSVDSTGLTGLEEKRKLEIQESIKAREEALKRIHLDDANDVATAIGSSLLTKAEFTDTNLNPITLTRTLI